MTGVVVMRGRGRGGVRGWRGAGIRISGGDVSNGCLSCQRLFRGENDESGDFAMKLKKREKIPRKEGDIKSDWRITYMLSFSVDLVGV